MPVSTSMEKVQDGSGPGNQSLEGDLKHSPQRVPDAETLRKFLEIPGSDDPHQHHAPVEPPSPAPLAKTAATFSCNIDFNQSIILNTLPNKAWNSFAYSPHYNISCGGVNTTFWLYTVPRFHDHYHLGYEDPWVCFDESTPKKMGRWSALPKRDSKCEWVLGTCKYNTTDPGTLPRQMYPHDKNEWVKTYVLDQKKNRRSFNLKSILIPSKSTTDACTAADYGKIQVWVKEASSQKWYYWSWIDPGQTFKPGTGSVSNGLDEMQITSPGAYGWKVDDIKLDVVY